MCIRKNNLIFLLTDMITKGPWSHFKDHIYLFSTAIWITTVVNEAPQIPFDICIYYLEEMEKNFLKSEA